jgi:hypothetical protein
MPIDQLDWEILNALSDDYESIEQIHGLITGFSDFQCTPHEILDRLEKLHKEHYVFLILNETFNRAKLLDEIENKTADRPYWFGRTETGYLAWQENTSRFVDEDA